MMVIYILIAAISSLFADYIHRSFNRLGHILNDVHACQIECSREFKPIYFAIKLTGALVNSLPCQQPRQIFVADLALLAQPGKPGLGFQLPFVDSCGLRLLALFLTLFGQACNLLLGEFLSVRSRFEHQQNAAMGMASSTNLDKYRSYTTTSSQSRCPGS